MAIRMNDEAFFAQFSIDNIDINEPNNNSKNNKFHQPKLESDGTLRDNGLYLLENPKLIGFFSDKQGERTPMYHIGFKNNESVFRVSGPCARHGEGSRSGDLIVYQSGLFPNFLLEPCGPDQLDVTIRTKALYSGFLIPGFDTDGNDDNHLLY